jgi:hypothetical protein
MILKQNKETMQILMEEIMSSIKQLTDETVDEVTRI